MPTASLGRGIKHVSKVGKNYSGGSNTERVRNSDGP